MFKPEIFTGIYRSLALLRTTILGVMAVVATSVATFMLPSVAVAAAHFSPPMSVLQVMQVQTLHAHALLARRLGNIRISTGCRPLRRFNSTGFYSA